MNHRKERAEGCCSVQEENLDVAENTSSALARRGAGGSSSVTSGGGSDLRVTAWVAVAVIPPRNVSPRTDTLTVTPFCKRLAGNVTKVPVCPPSHASTASLSSHAHDNVSARAEEETTARRSTTSHPPTVCNPATTKLGATATAGPCSVTRFAAAIAAQGTSAVCTVTPEGYRRLSEYDPEIEIVSPGKMVAPFPIVTDNVIPSSHVHAGFVPSGGDGAEDDALEDGKDEDDDDAAETLRARAHGIDPPMLLKRSSLTVKRLPSPLKMADATLGLPTNSTATSAVSDVSAAAADTCTHVTPASDSPPGNGGREAVITRDDDSE
mmetsp:Transcript_746/g.1440  ORF Transcript_746/g.1440 Transcript_746/m.1440 type:complete len:323 (-) Transcript_746:21-989(-)